MQDEQFEVNENQQPLCVEDLFKGAQETYEEAQARALEENKTFAKTEYFRMDKFGVYRLRLLPIAPNADGTIDRKSYEYPAHQLLMEIEKPSSGSKPSFAYVTAPRATAAGHTVDLIDTYRKLAVEEAKNQDNEKLAEKINGGSFGGGLKFNYSHVLYVFDMEDRNKGLQLLTLSHSQFKDLDERKFKLWQKKLSKNPSYPCPVSSIAHAYPVEIEKKKNGSKTEYLVSIDNESDVDVLTKEELTQLMNAPRIPEMIYRYTRFHYEATLEFLKQCDAKYELSIMELPEMQEAIEALGSELSVEDTSTFTFDKRTKDAKENAANGALLFDDLYNTLEDLKEKGLNDKSEEGQELRALIRSYIEQEKLPVRITRSTSNAELIELIEEELHKDPEAQPETDEEETPEADNTTPPRRDRNRTRRN